MNVKEIINLLKQHQNKRGIEHWNNLEASKCNYKSFGIGLTQLRKIAKQIGKNHALALELWSSNYYDAKVIAILIDEPKKITVEQMESQVQDIDFGMLVHVYSACGSPVSKVAFIDKIACDWLVSSNSIKRRCAYGFIYELSKSYKKSAPTEGFFLTQLNHIDETFASEDPSVLLSLGGALMGIGKRSVLLNQRALEVANKMGAIPVDSGVTNCEPFDVVKHLTSDYLRKKLGI